MLHIRGRGDVRCVLPTAAIRAVTTCAVGGEDGRPRLLRMHGPKRDPSKKDDRDEDATPPTYLRQRTSLKQRLPCHLHDTGMAVRVPRRTAATTPANDTNLTS